MAERAKRTARRVALVTGGSGGIGRGIAEALAGSGFDVAVAGRRQAADGAEVVRGLEQHGGAALYCSGDVADAADRQAIIEAVRQRLGRLDVLVNGPQDGAAAGADILDTTEASVDRLIAANIKGPYFLTQLVARWMVEQHEDDATFAGVIVNVAPADAVEAPAARGGYCISRAGIEMATQLWAVRLAEFGIAVYEVRPGIIAAEKKGTGVVLGQSIQNDSRPLFLSPEDVGRAVALLARGELTCATGNVLAIDGGLSLRRL